MTRGGRQPNAGARQCLALSDAILAPNQQYLATAHVKGKRSGVVLIWHTRASLRGRPRQQLHVMTPPSGGQVSAMAFSSDSDLICLGGSDGSLSVWHVTTGTRQMLLSSVESGVQSRIMSVAFSPDMVCVCACPTHSPTCDCLPTWWSISSHRSIGFTADCIAWKQHPLPPLPPPGPCMHGMHGLMTGCIAICTIVRLVCRCI